MIQTPISGRTKIGDIQSTTALADVTNTVAEQTVDMSSIVSAAVKAVYVDVSFRSDGVNQAVSVYQETGETDSDRIQYVICNVVGSQFISRGMIVFLDASRCFYFKMSVANAQTRTVIRGVAEIC